jgi:hypothetical protein
LSLGGIRAWGGTGAKEWYAVVLTARQAQALVGERERSNGDGGQCEQERGRAQARGVVVPLTEVHSASFLSPPADQVLEIALLLLTTTINGASRP